MTSFDLHAEVAGWPVGRASVAVLDPSGVLDRVDAGGSYPLASVTKIITSLAVLDGCADGTVSLDDEVGPPPFHTSPPVVARRRARLRRAPGSGGGRHPTELFECRHRMGRRPSRRSGGRTISRRVARPCLAAAGNDRHHGQWFAGQGRREHFAGFDPACLGITGSARPRLRDSLRCFDSAISGSLGCIARVWASNQQ